MSDLTFRIEGDLCLRCGACVAVCPAGALFLGEGGLERNPDKCLLCRNCEAVCPTGALTVGEGDG